MFKPYLVHAKKLQLTKIRRLPIFLFANTEPF